MRGMERVLDVGLGLSSLLSLTRTRVWTAINIFLIYQVN